jgi:hypothetical protein
MKWNEMKSNEMEWNGMKWNEMEWNGMKWNEMEWNGMEWNGMKWNEMEWNGMKWNEMEWNGMKWNEMEWRKRANAMPIMAAGDVKVQWASTGLIWSSSLNKLACVEFSVGLGPESLNGHVDVLGVGPAE